MPAIINADDGAISGASGLKLSSDTSGALNIQTNGVTAIAISASQAVSFPATTSLNFTSANITTLTSSSATITNLIATSGSITTLTNNPTFGAGTANGVLYLNGSKVVTSGSAVVFDGSNLGIGVTPSAWGSGSKAVELPSGISLSSLSGYSIIYNNSFHNGTNYIYKANGTAAMYQAGAGTHAWFTAASGTAGNTITFTAAMTLDASGNLIVGGTSAYGKISSQVDVNGNHDVWLRNDNAGASSACGYVLNASGNSWRIGMGSSANNGNALTWVVDINGSPSEKMRLTTGGELLVGQTAGSINVTGAYITGGGQGGFCVSGSTCILVNRKASDGTLVSFRQDDNEEGTISVSGATVSYNAFAGSHWSQLQDGSKPDILRGTVMESINELCEWPDETNERLPKSKISDTAGSKKVYGVFMAWDNDWTATNDMYVTAVGAFICRVNGNVTVQEGDLLESNGDGTARVQADDIIRSSTIGKVTSTVKTHQYDDGSYCVPTVLYCG
jgi:hypothetical protein